MAWDQQRDKALTTTKFPGTPITTGSNSRNTVLQIACSVLVVQPLLRKSLATNLPKAKFLMVRPKENNRPSQRTQPLLRSTSTSKNREACHSYKTQSVLRRMGRRW